MPGIPCEMKNDYRQNFIKFNYFSGNSNHIAKCNRKLKFTDKKDQIVISFHGIFLYIPCKMIQQCTVPDCQRVLFDNFK